MQELSFCMANFVTCTGCIVWTLLWTNRKWNWEKNIFNGIALHIKFFKTGGHNWPKTFLGGICVTQWVNNIWINTYILIFSKLCFKIFFKTKYGWPVCFVKRQTADSLANTNLFSYLNSRPQVNSKWSQSYLSHNSILIRVRHKVITWININKFSGTMWCHQGPMLQIIFLSSIRHEFRYFSIKVI